MEYSVEKFLKIVKRRKPRIPREKLEIFDQGWDRVIILAGDIAFSFPRNKSCQDDYPTMAAFSNELIKISPISIPHLKLDKEGDFLFATYKFIKGVPLEKRYLRSFDEDQREEIAKQLGNFLNILHSFPKDKVAQLINRDKVYLKSWKKQFEDMKKYVFTFLNQGEIEWTEKLYTRFLRLTKENPVKTAVIHGDMVSDHIIVDPKTKTLAGIIDCDVAIDDPGMDFAGLLMYYGQDFVDMVYKYYRLDRDKTFDQRMKFYRDRIHLVKLKFYFFERKSEIQQELFILKEYIKNNP